MGPKRRRARPKKAKLEHKNNDEALEVDDNLKSKAMGPKKRPGRPKKAKLEHENNDEALEVDDHLKSKPSTKLKEEKSVAVLPSEIAFDKLVNPTYSPPFRAPIRTYTNKRKLVQQSEDKVLEFSDCKNRDNIIAWLNDTRNKFDLIALTQKEQVSQVPDENVYSLDLPSVSQLNTSNKRKRVTQRSPYKLRARSLDISVSKTKNSKIGRIKRHSLAGDTATLENYNIEDATDEDNSPVEAKLLIKLLEDEYLDSIEQEMNNDSNDSDNEKRNLTGWERINVIKKAVPKKKQPKRLKIEVSQNQNLPKKNDESHENLTCDLKIVEDYFTTEMAKLLNENNKNQQTVSSASVDVLNYLKGIDQVQKDELKNRLFPIYNELKNLFSVDKIDIGVQCDGKRLIDQSIQTVELEISKQVQKRDIESQTICSEFRSIEAQNDKIKTDSIAIQTNSQDVAINNILRSGTNTPSDIFASAQNDNRELENENDMNNTLDDISFETEDINANLNNDKKVIAKRARQESPDQNESEIEPKRPCNKFINNDLSIAFESCTERFNNIKPQSEEFGDDSEDLKMNATLVAIMKKYERSSQSPSPQPQPPPQLTPKPRTTQEEMEYYENLLNNATKNDMKPKEKSISLNSSDVIVSNNVFVDPQNLDYFKACENSPPKSSSRRNLFQDKSTPSENQDGKYSESLFANETVSEINKNASAAGKIQILQNIVVKERSKHDDNFSDGSDDAFFSDVDVVETTPQKMISNIAHKTSPGPFLDVILPPPLVFQDDLNSSNDVTLIHESPERPEPLADLKQNQPNKISSTPRTNKPESEPFPSLSPITPRVVRVSQDGVLSAIDLAQQSKFSPLTIIKRQPPQSHYVSTPKQQKSILNYMNKSQEAQTSQINSKNKPCISCTRLSRDQVIQISALTNKKLASYSSTFTNSVTHMVVSVNNKNCLKDYTMKFVSAVAAGIWVVSFGWIQECLAQNTIIPEEPYEVLDISGIAGPRISRLTRLSNPLLKGFRICIVGPLVSTTLKEIENVVTMLGGKISQKPEDLLDKRDDICLIITEARATQDFDMYETWLEALRVVTVDIEWLGRSVGQYNLLSLRPFALCSDDSIDDLGYPPKLLVKTPFSFSQNTYSTFS